MAEGQSSSGPTSKDGDEAKLSLSDITSDMIMHQSKSSSDDFIQFSELENPREGKNELFLICEQCKCRIVRPGFAVLTDKELFLPNMMEKHAIGSEPHGDDLTLFWLVEDMYHFENVGFSKVVNGCEQYLVCADCEIGPIGWTNIHDRNKLYVAAERVRYAKS